MEKDNKLETSLYDDYFKEDLEAIEEELKKSKEYSKIIDEEIEKLSMPGLATKGNQHYLIEHITNAVQLQTQRQGLRKDRVAIKKLILDYSNKELDRLERSKTEDTSSKEMLETLKKLLETEKEPIQKVVVQSTKNLDEEIDDILKDED